MNALTAEFVAANGEDEAQLWRGRCLNFFARGERAIANTLLCATDNGHKITLRHLSGQQIGELEKLVASLAATPKQNLAFDSALSEWKAVQDRRQFLAHGASTIAYETQGNWLVLLDVIAFRSKDTTIERWTIRKTEAEEFQADLHKAFNSLSGQLGHLRQRLKVT